MTKTVTCYQEYSTDLTFESQKINPHIKKKMKLKLSSHYTHPHTHTHVHTHKHLKKKSQIIKLLSKLQIGKTNKKPKISSFQANKGHLQNTTKHTYNCLAEND